MTTMIDRPRSESLEPLRVRWYLWIGFAVLWTIALIAPISEDVSFSSDPDTNRLIRLFLAKSLHALAYTSWTVLTGSLRTGFGGRILLLFFLMAHAAGTEWIQLRVGRDGCLRDVL